ncbi:MAG: peptidoglycan DD-metalloendopeptidase family protein [Spirochaetia bacterium]|nr:peptidoglycan DD-metalloendopeptidase family protein [Spirochaetia bacterium]
MSPVHHYKRAEKRFVARVLRFFSVIGDFLARFFGAIAGFFRQQVTVMLVPHSERNIFNFRISAFSMVVVIFLIVCMVLTFILYSTRFTGVSDLLADKTQVLEQRDADLEIIRDQISDLLNTSRVFEDSLHSTLDNLGLEKSNAEKKEKAAVKLGDEVAELTAMKGLLQDSLEYFDQIAKMLQAQQSLIVELPTIWPLRDVRGYVTSYFGPTTHPFTKHWYLHKGIDIAYSRGTKVVSTADGKVIEKAFDAEGYGNYIVIKHKYGFYTRYAHMDKVYVKEGQNVQQGEVIGTLGSTGLSTGPHLHYEVRIGSQVVDPQRYLDFNSSKNF